MIGEALPNQRDSLRGFSTILSMTKAQGEGKRCLYKVEERGWGERREGEASKRGQI